ncbi:MAG: hypothetical protein HC866_03485 [Leptolyngbyaceae cyanobacterium RU_5_1]|nr:hypothetical protein [Leptolyngbyaceae cyanobacterium RU_5_1]
MRCWHQATWEAYVALRDALIQDRMRLAFNQGWLWVEVVFQKSCFRL